MSESSIAGSPEPWKHKLSSVERYSSGLESETFIKWGKVSVAAGKVVLSLYVLFF